MLDPLKIKKGSYSRLEFNFQLEKDVIKRKKQLVCKKLIEAASETVANTLKLETKPYYYVKKYPVLESLAVWLHKTRDLLMQMHKYVKSCNCYKSDCKYEECYIYYESEVESFLNELNKLNCWIYKELDKLN